MILMLAGISVAQTTTDGKAAENEAKLKKEAVEFLRETQADVGRLRTMENRISFSAELASLMWFHDEKEAKAMYGGVVSDFKQLIAQLDAQMNLPVVENDEMTSPGFFGGYGKSKAERKLRIAMMVRQQIALSLAEHAPDLAYNFYYDSINIITNAAFRKETEQSDIYFENQLLTQIAQFDPGKAVEIATKSLDLSKGFNERHLELLKKIYDKDAKKGAEFGSAILGAVKATRIDAEGDVYLISLLLEFGGEKYDASRKSGGKAPVYTAAELRDIAELLSQKILSYDEEEMSSAEAYAEKIEKYAPGRAAQIRTKFRKVILEQERLNHRVTRSYSKVANVAANTTAADPTKAKYEAEQRAREDREKREKQMIADVMNLGKKELPKEERAKIIAESRKIISQTQGKDKKIMGLTVLAAQVTKAGDKDLADEIMRDAERLVNPEPKNYQDFLLSWMLASGYAEANPDKAFPILENTILRANETISAFIKVAEFIDVNAEIVDDGEVQVGMFGGEMIRGLTRELALASSAIRTLSAADFAKTRNLTSIFDRTEIRVLAKMMVLRAVLDKKQPKEIKLDEMMPDVDPGGVVFLKQQQVRVRSN